MSTLAINHVYQIRTYCYSQPQLAINTRYVMITALTGPPKDTSDLVLVVDNALAPLYKPLLTNVAQYLGTSLQDITGDRPYPVASTTQANKGNGTGGVQPMPGQVSGIYSVYGDTAARAFRGRAYIPFPDVSAGTTGSPSNMKPAYQTLLVALADYCVGPVVWTVGTTTVTAQFGIQHAVGTPLAGTFNGWYTNGVGQNWATQKRRGDFGRTNPAPPL